MNPKNLAIDLYIASGTMFKKAWVELNAEERAPFMTMAKMLIDEYVLFNRDDFNELVSKV